MSSTFFKVIGRRLIGRRPIWLVVDQLGGVKSDWRVWDQAGSLRSKLWTNSHLRSVNERRLGYAQQGWDTPNAVVDRSVGA